MSIDPQKMQNLLDEVLNGMSEQTKKFEEKFASSRGLFQDVQKQLMAYVEKKCASQIEGLNSSPSNANKQDYDAKFREFEDCATKNDFGFSDFMRGIQQQESTTSDNDQKCISECTKQNTKDEEIKSCFRHCLNISNEKYMDLTEKIEAKINEISKLI
jgi:hypothetical protein